MAWLKKQYEYMSYDEYHKHISTLALSQWQQQTRKECIKNSSLVADDEVRRQNKLFVDNMREQINSTVRCYT